MPWFHFPSSGLDASVCLMGGQGNRASMTKCMKLIKSDMAWSGGVVSLQEDKKEEAVPSSSKAALYMSSADGLHRGEAVDREPAFPSIDVSLWTIMLN